MSIQNLSGDNFVGLVPIIIIRDRDNNELYRFEHELAVNDPANAVQELKVTGFHLHDGTGTDHGRLSLAIDDPDIELTNDTKSDRPLLISPQTIVNISFFVAGDSSNPAPNTPLSSIPIDNQWFEGYIYDPGVEHPLPFFQQANIFAIGNGVEYSERLTSIRRTQERDSTGIDFDPNDVSTRITTIAKDLINDVDHYPFQGLPRPDFSDAGIVDQITQLGDFNKHFNTINDSLQELANRGGMIWGVISPKREVYMHIRGSVDSGILMTNDLSSIKTENWPKNNLCSIRKRPNGYRDTTIGYGMSHLAGVGSYDDILKIDKTAANASLDLSAFEEYAFPFVYDTNSIAKIALFLTKVNTPSQNLTLSILGATTGGAPNSSDVRKTITIAPELLQKKLTASGDWFEQNFRVFDTGIVTEPNNTYFIAIRRYSDAPNEIRLDYQTGTGTYYVRTGSTWNSTPGDAKIRVYRSQIVNILLENTNAKRRFGIREMALPMNDFPTTKSAVNGMIGFSKIVGRRRRIYEPIHCTPPLVRPKIGGSAQLVDIINGLATKVDLVGYDIQATSLSQFNRGTDLISFHLEDLFY